MSRLHTPSALQEAIFAFTRQGRGHGVVEVTAGSGKTATLVEAAHRLPGGTEACFVAFNAHAAAQFKTHLPPHVQARTVHALGLTTLRASLRKNRRDVRVVKDKSRSLENFARLIRLELATPAEMPRLVGRCRLGSSGDPELTPVRVGLGGA